jgi:hypothetical protein
LSRAIHAIKKREKERETDREREREREREKERERERERDIGRNREGLGGGQALTTYDEMVGVSDFR